MNEECLHIVEILLRKIQYLNQQPKFTLIGTHLTILAFKHLGKFQQNME